MVRSGSAVEAGKKEEILDELQLCEAAIATHCLYFALKSSRDGNLSASMSCSSVKSSLSEF
jgi:hypothetical protein